MIRKPGRKGDKSRGPFDDTRNTEQPFTGLARLVFRCAAHKRVTWPVATLVTPVFTNVEIQFGLLSLCQWRNSDRETFDTFSFLGHI